MRIFRKTYYRLFNLIDNVLYSKEFVAALLFKHLKWYGKKDASFSHYV